MFDWLKKICSKKEDEGIIVDEPKSEENSDLSTPENSVTPKAPVKSESSSPFSE